jgi:hypothetical protein
MQNATLPKTLLRVSVLLAILIILWSIEFLKLIDYRRGMLSFLRASAGQGSELISCSYV